MPEEYEKLKISSVFKERLEELVSYADCNKSNLPKVIGINKDVFYRAVNLGVVPSSKVMVKIADYFNVSISFLLALTDIEAFYKSDSKTTFYDRLDELINQKNMTKYAIGKKLDINRGSFKNWRDKKYLPVLETLNDLAIFFEVSIDYLLGRTDDKNYD